MDENDATTPNSDDADPYPAIQILVANQHNELLVDQSRVQAAVRVVIEDTAIQSALVSVALVDDSTIHRLNRQFLQHDYPTDVLSFVLEASEDHLEGDLIVSADTAIRNAADYGWSPSQELLLYVIHGALHLVGYRDEDPAERKIMRAAEARYLHKLDITLPGAGESMSQGFQAESLGEVRAS